ncbi:MAG: hypothetical protein H6551_05400 [Chitinophagales bacterium]|nr:hypothetical protein [Chitinophagaceae bacterium]MCB9064565.1 hypothetical protein [Chitinophagales bacterium]
MRNLRPVYLLVFMLTLLAIGCKKEKQNKIHNQTGTTTDPNDPTTPGNPTNPNNPGNPSTPGNYTFSKVFNDLEVKYKTLTIDATKDNSFFGNSGTRYVIKANALVTPGGAPVTGNVQVQVREFLNRGDMIFSRMLPVSDGAPLVSGGEIDIQVTQNGTPLNLRPNTPLQVFVPQKGNADPDMQVFSGQPVTGDPQNQVNWRVDSPRVIVDSLQVVDTSNRVVPIYRPGAQDTLKMISDKLRLCNIDKYLKIYQNELITVKVTSSGDTIPNSTPLFCYALFNNLNIAYPIYIYDLNNTREVHLMKLPINFVAFTIINGHFYGGVVTPAQKTGTTVNIVLNKVDPAAFKITLNNL